MNAKMGIGISMLPENLDNAETESFVDEEGNIAERLKNFKQLTKQEKDASKHNEKMLEQLKKEYKNISDAYANGKVKLHAIIQENKGIISNELEYQLMEDYFDLIASEAKMTHHLEKEVARQPIWTTFLKDIRGIGPLMSGVIISELDPYKARHVSSFWKYAGLDVIVNNDGVGEGRSKRKEHLVQVKYANKDGVIKERDSITYNPMLKSKLVKVVPDCFARSHNEHYTKVKNDYYHGQLCKYATIKSYDKDKKPVYAFEKGITHAHIIARANRYVAKMFMRDLWVAWRTVENLPVSEPYEVAKLGMKPHGFNY